MMKDREMPIHFDRAFILKNTDEIERFFDGPERYLEEIGALASFPSFKGFVDIENNKIEVEEFASEFRSKVGTYLTIGHFGIPYANYCTWIIY